MDVDYREMDRLLEQYCRQQSEDPGDDLVATEFTSGSLPSLRENAVRNKLSVDDYNGTWMWGWSVTKLLFEALHDDYRRSDWKPRYLWRHQQFSLFKTLDASRGFSIDKEMLLKAASIYLSHPEIRTNKLDWLFLDSIVFLELDLYGDHFFKQRGGAGTNWAAVFATEKQHNYFLLKFIFFILSFIANYLAIPAFAYYLLVTDHPTGALITGGLWGLSMLFHLGTYPFRRRARVKAKKLMQELLDLYTILGDTTISPRKLKEKLDTATTTGVVLDGSVFTIVDRLVAADPTAFIPHVGR